MVSFLHWRPCPSAWKVGDEVSEVPALQRRRSEVLRGVRVAAGTDMCALRPISSPPTAKFCSECAQPTGVSTSTQTPFGSPETYTPKHLAGKILTSRAALEGERKQVTVLFADLKGSMELLADRDPEEARKLLDPVLEHMMEAVHHYEGTVNQVMGDGIMALFGAPLAHEDHAVRACYAALRMQERIKRHAEGRSPGSRREPADPRRPQLRRGRGTRHRQRSAHGLHGHRPDDAPGGAHGAAREPGQHPADASRRWRLAEGFVAVKPLGPVPVKGLADALDVYEVTGAGPARTRLQAGARRGLTRFVGRDAELEQLRRVATARRQTATVRSWRSLPRPGWASRASSTSSPTRRPSAGLAGARVRLGLVRQGDELPAGDQPAQGATSKSRTATTSATSATR